MHAEVYTDAAKLGTYQGAKTTDAVNTYALTYEPALFLADADDDAGRAPRQRL